MKREDTAMICAKMAEQIKMPFGLWTQVHQGSMCYMGCILMQPGKYDWYVHVRVGRMKWRWCALCKITLTTCYY